MYVEAIWLRCHGDKVQVLFESLGKWHLAIEESAPAAPTACPWHAWAFSHIAEHPTLQAAPEDHDADNPYMRGGRVWITAN